MTRHASKQPEAEKQPLPKRDEPEPKKAPAPEQRPHLVTRCPGCAREIAESAEVCPYCKRDFRVGPKRPATTPPVPFPQQERPKEPDPPKHMIADLEAPAKEPPKKDDKPAPKPAEPEKPKDERRPDPRSLGDFMPPRTMIMSAPASSPPEQKEPALPPIPQAGPDEPRPAPKPVESKAAEQKAPEPKPAAKPMEPKAAESKPGAPAPEQKEPAHPPIPQVGPDAPSAAKASEEEKPKAKDAEHVVLLTRCPGCARPISETAEICPHCKRDFRTPVQKAGPKEVKNGGASAAPSKGSGPKELDLPRHMMADMDAPARSLDSQAAEVLPPHMLEGMSTEVRAPRAKSTGLSAVLFAVVGLAILAAILVPLLKKKPVEEPPPAVVVTPVPAPTPPEPAPEPAQKPPEPAQKSPEPQPPAAVVQEPPKPEPAPVEKKGKGKKGKQAGQEMVAVVSHPEPAPAQKRASKCRIQGRIFDLVSLKGVPDVDIVFVDPSGLNVRTVSGADGNYRAMLPFSSHGYEVQVRHDDYLPRYIPDNNYRSMGEDARKQEAKKFTQFSPNNPTISTEGEEQIKQDFAMIPREKHGKTLEEALQQ